MERGPAFKQQFVIVDYKYGKLGGEIKRFDSEMEAITALDKMFPRDLMGTRELCILPIYTNKGC